MINKDNAFTKINSDLIIKGYNQKKLKSAFLIDKFFKLISPSKPVKSIPASFNYILVVQSHLIGDLVMAIPLLKAVKKRYPDAKVVLLANDFAKDLLKGVWFVDDIITLKFPWSTYDYSLKNIIFLLKTIIFLRKKNIDLAIDAQIDIRNAFLMFLTGAKRRLGYALTGGSVFLTDIPDLPDNVSGLLETRLSVLNYLGIKIEEKNPDLPVTQEALTYVNNFLKINNIKSEKIIGIHPGASKEEKLWSSKNFSDIIKYILSKGLEVVIIEGPKDKIIVEEIQRNLEETLLKFKGDLQSVFVFISKCKFFICLDSASIHLAGMTGIPVIGIYGPQLPYLTKPSAANIEILWNETLNCRPCEYGRCKYDTNLCMESITAQQVIGKINKIIEK